MNTPFDEVASGNGAVTSGVPCRSQGAAPYLNREGYAPL